MHMLVVGQDTAMNVSAPAAAEACAADRTGAMRAAAADAVGGSINNAPAASNAAPEAASLRRRNDGGTGESRRGSAGARLPVPFISSAPSAPAPGSDLARHLASKDDEPYQTVPH